MTRAAFAVVFLLLLLFPALSISQTSGEVAFSGIVVDSSSGGPLVGAVVYLPDLGRGTTADTEGEFRIDALHPGRYAVVVRYTGYTERREVVTLAVSIRRRYELASTPIPVADVTVTGTSDREDPLNAIRSLTVLSAEEIDRTRGQSLGHTLEHVPGVTLLQTGPSIAKPVLRGLHSNRLLLTNAGIRQEGQQWGGEHAPEIDPFAISRIEVLRGSAAVEFGSDAIGGVIRLEPRELRKSDGYAGELSLNGYSNSEQGAIAGWVEGRSDLLTDVAWRIQGSVRKAGDSRTPLYVMSNTGFREMNGSAYVGVGSDGFDLTAYVSMFTTELGVLFGSHIGNLSDLERAIKSPRPLVAFPFTYDVRNPRQVISHELLTLNSSIRIPSIGQLNLVYGWQQNRRQEYDSHGYYSDSLNAIFGGRPAFDLALTTYTVDAKIRHLPFGRWFGTFGVSLTRQGNVTSGKSILFPNFRVYSGGMFVIEEYSAEPWYFTAGARYDYRWLRTFMNERGVVLEDTRTYGSVSGSIGSRYTFHPEWSVGVNIGTAWRPPSINELYSDGIHHGLAQYELGDPTLSTERNASVDVTVHHEAPSHHGEVSIYMNSFDNYIYLRPDGQPRLTVRGAFPSFTYAETRVLMFGFDASADSRVSENLTIGISSAVVHGTDVNANEPLIGLPSDRVRVSATYDLDAWLGLKRGYVGAGLTAVARQTRVPAGLDYSEPPPGYYLLDLNAGGTFRVGSQAFEIFVTIQNVFDRTYREYMSRFRYFIDEPGRNVVARIHIPFGDREESGVFH